MCDPEDPAATLSAEDLKIIALARSARARSGAPEGAAVRDETGRTYVASTVALPTLAISALRLAVAQAVASGAGGLEAAALVGDPPDLDARDARAVVELGGGAVEVFGAAPDGVLRWVRRAGRS
ncbi:MAG: cytidine/deoxycytidylate deaminase family protein [Actinomycetes bacterium]